MPRRHVLGGSCTPFRGLGGGGVGVFSRESPACSAWFSMVIFRGKVPVFSRGWDSNGETLTAAGWQRDLTLLYGLKGHRMCPRMNPAAEL